RHGRSGWPRTTSRSRGGPTGHAADTASISAIRTVICWNWRRRVYGRSIEAVGWLEQIQVSGASQDEFRCYLKDMRVRCRTLNPARGELQEWLPSVHGPR